MVFKKKSFLVVLSVFLFSFLNFPQAVFAQGNLVCSGKIVGVTAVGAGTNVNTGVTSFDENLAVDLSIVGSVTGFAPASTADAACANKEAGTYEGQAYEYALKGWAWNTNGGFISFSCQNGLNDAGGNSVACGNQNYGVYLSPDLGGGARKIFGYAWSPTFGWIRFNNWYDNPAPAILYGVGLDASGATSGYAWTSSRVYMNFTGLTITLPDNPLVPVVPGVPGAGAYCQGKSYVGICVELTPDPLTLQYDLIDGTAKAWRIADGVSGYNVNLYFHDQNGLAADPTDVTKFPTSFINGITFDWKDTVKADQTTSGAAVSTNLNKISEPIKNKTFNGAVVYKPISFSNFKQVKVGGVNDVGHFEADNLVTSYAPTSGSKRSLTTNTTPHYSVNNEDFATKPDGLNVDTLEKNQLVLNYVTYPDPGWTDVNGKHLLPAGSAFPNGQNGMNLEFRPAVFVNTLYAGTEKDDFLLYRGLVSTITRGVKIIGDFLNNSSVASTAQATFNLSYSAAKTDTQCSGQVSNFIFDIINTINGVADTQSGVPNYSFTEPVSSLTAAPVVLSATPQLPAGTPDTAPCKVAQGPIFYSVVSYFAGGRNILYYDNKLPRTSGLIINPAVVVRGSISAQAVTTVSSDARIETGGAQTMKTIRDTIYANLQRYTDQNKIFNPGKCSISGLVPTGPGITYGSCTADYIIFDIGQEHVVYFKGSDVTLDFSNSNWKGKWVIVADEGNIFIDKDLYSTDSPAPEISLIALRPASNDPNYYAKGNIYINPKVANIQAALVADGTVYSYDGKYIDIDPLTGEPVWQSSDYRITTLGASQLLIQGSVLATGNTIGGADLDQGMSAKNYILAGGGKVIASPASPSDRLMAQDHDLNYLRTFGAGLQIVNGFPVDQQCKKPWTAADQTALESAQLAGTSYCGELKPCDPTNPNSQNACDGIDPLNLYDPLNPASGGDLMPPDPKTVTLSKGLDNTKDFAPAYVYYVKPNSALFLKTGATGIK